MADFRRLQLKQFPEAPERDTAEGRLPVRPASSPSHASVSVRYWKRFAPKVLEKYVRPGAARGPNAQSDTTCSMPR